MSVARAHESYGQHGLTWVDRFGVWLSQSAIRKHLPPDRDLEIVELGCGYRAIDPVLHNLAPLTFLEGPIEEALSNLAGQTFDVVMLISVLEHLEHPFEALVAARQLLKPGGVLLINVPTWRGKFFLELSAFRFGLSPKTEIDDHKMYYDKRDLWPLLVRTGFLPSAIRLRYHKFGLNLFATACRI